MTRVDGRVGGGGVWIVALAGLLLCAAMAALVAVRRGRGARTRLRPLDDADGSVSVALVLLLVIVLAGAGLIFDGAQFLAAERHASNTAEGAARAAVATGSPARGFDAAEARHAAIDHAVALGVAAADVRVTFPNATTVLVTITERRTSVFVLGAATMTAHADGRARWEFT